MKITSKTNTVFKPFSINIEFETEDEAMRFYNLFNYSPICEAVFDKMGTAAEIRNIIRDNIESVASSKFIEFVKSLETNILLSLGIKYRGELL